MGTCSGREGETTRESLAQFEEDNRKHGDLVTLQKIIAVLTFALVMVGIIQAIAIYFSSKT